MIGSSATNQCYKARNCLEILTFCPLKLRRDLISSFSFNRNYLVLLMHTVTHSRPAFYAAHSYCVNTMWHIISSKQKANHVFPWGRISRYSRLLLWHRDRSVLFSTVPAGFSFPHSSPIPPCYSLLASAVQWHTFATNYAHIHLT